MHRLVPYVAGSEKMCRVDKKDIFINPRRACAAKVTVVVLCVCVCVHSYLPPHALESQKRDANGFIAIQGSF